MSAVERTIASATALYKQCSESYADERYEESYDFLVRALRLFTKVTTLSEQARQESDGIVRYPLDEKIDYLFFVVDKFKLAIACNIGMEENQGAGHLIARIEDLIEDFEKLLARLSDGRDLLPIERQAELAQDFRLTQGFRVALANLKKVCSQIPNERLEIDEVQEILKKMLILQISFLYSNYGNDYFPSVATPQQRSVNLESQSNHSSSSDSSCFIATAAYGTSEHADLDTFRGFRDQKLLTNFFGQQFVRFYYKFSPFLASLLKKHPPAQKVIRSYLEQLAAKLRN